MKNKNEGHIYIVKVVGNSCCGYGCLAPLSNFFQLYRDEEHRTNYKHA
jgi:hypothetical protein